MKQLRLCVSCPNTSIACLDVQGRYVRRNNIYVCDHDDRISLVKDGDNLIFKEDNVSLASSDTRTNELMLRHRRPTTRASVRVVYSREVDDTMSSVSLRVSDAKKTTQWNLDGAYARRPAGNFGHHADAQLVVVANQTCDIEYGGLVIGHVTTGCPPLDWSRSFEGQYLFQFYGTIRSTMGIRFLAHDPPAPEAIAPAPAPASSARNEPPPLTIGSMVMDEMLLTKKNSTLLVPEQAVATPVRAKPAAAVVAATGVAATPVTPSIAVLVATSLNVKRLANRRRRRRMEVICATSIVVTLITLTCTQIINAHLSLSHEPKEPPKSRMERIKSWLSSYRFG